MIRRPPRSTRVRSSAASDVYKRQDIILDLDLAVLRQAVADFARWRPHHPWLSLNVNLSARHFDYSDCVERITGAITGMGMSPSAVNLEVTETAAMAANPSDRNFLADLRERGFRILLDDFGTGFSMMAVSYT